MKQIQKGFTLIELMIVVAIIGILAAIAIPQYQDYVTRSRWATAITEIASVRTAISECLQINGGDPTLCDTPAEVGFTAANFPTSISGGLIAVGSTWATTGAAPVGGTVRIDLGGSTAPAGCTVAMVGTVGETGVRWTYTGTGTNCTQSRSGFTKS